MSECRVKRAINRALLWQTIPMIATITFASDLINIMIGAVLMVIVTPLVAGIYHRSITVALVAVALPFGVFALLAASFALIVYVPKGQHP